MAESTTGGNYCSKMTSQDLEALVSIQAALDRLGSNLASKDIDSKVVLQNNEDDRTCLVVPELESAGVDSEIRMVGRSDAVDDVLDNNSRMDVAVVVSSYYGVDEAASILFEPDGIDAATSVASDESMTVSGTVGSYHDAFASASVSSSVDITAATTCSFAISESVATSCSTVVTACNVSGTTMTPVDTIMVTPEIGAFFQQKAVVIKETSLTKFKRLANHDSNNDGSPTKSVDAPPACLCEESGEDLLSKVVMPAAAAAVCGTMTLAPGIERQLASNVTVESKVHVPAAVKTRPGGALSSALIVNKVIIPNNAAARQLQCSTGQTAIPTCLSKPVQNIAAVRPVSLVGQITTVTPNQTMVSSSPSKQHFITTIPGTPPKQIFLSGHIPLRPKVPTTITILPAAKSPQKIAPSPVRPSAQLVSKGSVLSLVTTAAAMTTAKREAKSMPPLKSILKQSKPTITRKPSIVTMVPIPTSTTATSNNRSISTSKEVTVPTQTVSSAGLQAIQVPGNVCSYIMLVAAPTSTPLSTTSTTGSAVKPQVLNPVLASTTKPIAPLTVTTIAPSSQPDQQTSSASLLKVAAPIAPAISGQSLIRPALSGIAIPANTLIQLPPGSTIVPVAPVVMTVGQSTSILPVLPAANRPSVSTNPSGTSVSLSVDRGRAPSSTKNQLNGKPSVVEPGRVRTRRPCKCIRFTRCLKFYCDCFASGEFCHNCNCNNCYNNLEHEYERRKAIKACLERNPQAFRPKIGKSKDGEIERRHNKGCNCKRSGCLKNYCECYEAKMMCSVVCKCIDCKNFEDSAERKALVPGRRRRRCRRQENVVEPEEECNQKEKQGVNAPQMPVPEIQGGGPAAQLGNKDVSRTSNAHPTTMTTTKRRSQSTAAKMAIRSRSRSSGQNYRRRALNKCRGGNRRGRWWMPPIPPASLWAQTPSDTRARDAANGGVDMPYSRIDSPMSNSGYSSVEMDVAQLESIVNTDEEMVARTLAEPASTLQSLHNCAQLQHSSDQHTLHSLSSHQHPAHSSHQSCQQQHRLSDGPECDGSGSTKRQHNLDVTQLHGIYSTENASRNATGTYGGGLSLPRSSAIYIHGMSDDGSYTTPIPSHTQCSPISPNLMDGYRMQQGPMATNMGLMDQGHFPMADVQIGINVTRYEDVDILLPQP